MLTGVLTRPVAPIADSRSRDAAHAAASCAGHGKCAFGIAVALTDGYELAEVPLEMSQAGLGLRLKQQLTLTPRLQQSVKLLQLSALECVQELNQAIAQNPFLEEPTEASDSRNQNEQGSEENSSRSELDFASPGSGSGSGSSGPDDTPDWTEWTASPSTLRDSL